MMENSDSDTFDTLVFDALVSTEADSNSRVEIILVEFLLSGNEHLHTFKAQFQM